MYASDIPWFTSWQSNWQRSCPGSQRSISRARAVGGAVVDHDELVDEGVELVEHRRDHRLFVVRRHHRDAARAGGAP